MFLAATPNDTRAAEPDGKHQSQDARQNQHNSTSSRFDAAAQRRRVEHSNASGVPAYVDSRLKGTTESRRRICAVT